MGYYNDLRPHTVEFLTLDVLCDLTDLAHDINNGVSSEDLLNAIEFIKETVRIIRRNNIVP